jgi:hypothetical protein
MGKFKIDGQVEPLDEHIQSLDGLTFDGLPDADSRAFLRTPVRLYEIKHYKPEEPAEIFFRLNQPTALTAAEKRNAFYGPVRDQIRQIVVRFVGGQLEPESALGFTNSRMAFDDVFARLACTLEIGTLRKKVTAPAVNQMYRRSTPLSDMVEKKLEYCVDIWWSVSQIVSSSLPDNYPRLNKATFFSWLLFYSRLTAVGDLKSIANFFIHFESVRKKLSGFDSDQNRSRSAQKDELLNNLSQLMLVYSDRASARVADVSSVMLRDFVLWASWKEFSGGNKAGCVDPAYLRIDGWRDRNRCGADHFESKLLEFIELIHWGETL